MLLEVVLSWLLRPPLTRLFENAEQLKGNHKGVRVLVTTCITKIVGTIHNTIQVRLDVLACIPLQDAHAAVAVGPQHGRTHGVGVTVMRWTGWC